MRVPEQSPFDLEGHLLDVVLQELAEADTEAPGTSEHLADCLVCRSRLRQLRGEAPLTVELDAIVSQLDDPPSVPPSVEAAIKSMRRGENAGPGELWLTEGPLAVMVWIRKVVDHSVFVQPAIFDVEFADNMTFILGPEENPLGVPLGIVCSFDSQISVESLHGRLCTLDVGDAVASLRSARRAGSSPPQELKTGPPLSDVRDERLEYRQEVADALSSRSTPNDPLDQSDIGDLRDLLEELRARRGMGCRIDSCDAEIEALAADAGWTAVAEIRELDVTLLVLLVGPGGDVHGVARAALNAADATAVAVAERGREYLTCTYDIEQLADDRIFVASETEHEPRSALGFEDALFKYLEANVSPDEMIELEQIAAGPSDPLAELAREASLEAVNDARRRRFQGLKGAAFKALTEDHSSAIAHAITAAATDGRIVDRILEHR